MLLCISIFRIVTMNGLVIGEMNIHICYDKNMNIKWDIWGIYWGIYWVFFRILFEYEYYERYRIVLPFNKLYIFVLVVRLKVYPFIVKNVSSDVIALLLPMFPIIILFELIPLLIE